MTRAPPPLKGEAMTPSLPIQMGRWPEGPEGSEILRRFMKFTRNGFEGRCDKGFRRFLMKRCFCGSGRREAREPREESSPVQQGRRFAPILASDEFFLGGHEEAGVGKR